MQSPALSSMDESFWSLSRTLSTFKRIISTTSSTCALVASNRLAAFSACLAAAALSAAALASALATASALAVASGSALLKITKSY